MSTEAVTHDDGFVGYVLCGGSSRRMGRDKALVEIDGVALAVRVTAALTQAGATSVHAVGGDETALSARGLDVVADLHPGEGPLGGILTALDHAGRRARLVVVSCDLVSPDPAALRRVVDELARSDADVVVPEVDGRRQWLHAAWAGRCAGIVADVFAAGERAVVAGTRSLRVHVIQDVAAAAVRDADRPQDLPGPARTQ